MSINLDAIKNLRDKTGAGMTACKKALEESGGDMEKAVEYLRKQGIAKAAKREGREAGEGVIKLAVSDNRQEGYMVELNAETDFVAKNEKFQALAVRVLDAVKENKPADTEALLALPLGEETVEQALGVLSGTIGEKMLVKGVAVLESTGTVAAYSHMNGRIGVLAALDQPDKTELAHDIAMQIAAADPKYITPDEVPAGELEKEKAIYREQLEKEGKPDIIIGKILEGKVNKYYEQVCLVKQEYIKDDKKKVEDILGDVKVEKFVRFSLI